jgi:inorganic pyrophosphatase
MTFLRRYIADWSGSLSDGKVNAIICTVDLMKKDSEIKILVGCTDEEMSKAYEFHSSTEFMKGILVRR